MALTLLAIVVPVLIWWGSTGIVLYLVKRPRETYGTTVFAATLLLFAAIPVIALLAPLPSQAAAVAGYAAGIVVWGWLEATFLTGYLTGPHAKACPADAAGGVRFRQGILTSLYHELAVIAFGAGLIALTWGAVNQTATWTFLVLWGMRWSAKLNLFLGVPNMNYEFFPPHLEHLKSYIARRAFNPLFPVVIAAATLIFAALVREAWLLPADSFARFQLILVATTLGLAILEHWFLVLPFKDEALWRWAEPRASHLVVEHSVEPIGAGNMIRGDSKVAG